GSLEPGSLPGPGRSGSAGHCAGLSGALAAWLGPATEHHATGDAGGAGVWPDRWPEGGGADCGGCAGLVQRVALCLSAAGLVVADSGDPGGCDFGGSAPPWQFATGLRERQTRKM